MNMYDDTTAEVLRLQSPEKLGEHRVYALDQALVLLEHSMNAMGIAPTDELPTTPVVPQSAEVTRYQEAQDKIAAEAEKTTKEVVTDRVMNDVYNAYEGAEHNPLFNIGNVDA